MNPTCCSPSPALPSSESNNPEKELPSVAMQQKDLCLKLKQVYLTQRVITYTEPLISPPDIQSIRQLKVRITDAKDKVHTTAWMGPNVTDNNKEKLLTVLTVLQSSLNSFEGKQIPDKYPDYSKLEGVFDNREVTEFFSDIFYNFKEIADKRSFVRIDKAMITQLASYLKGCSCLEVYAGNGWLSSELQKKGVNIYATDNFQDNKGQESPFIRTVEKCDALQATLQFLQALPAGQQGVIILGFSEGDHKTLLNITTSPLIRRDIRTICIEPPCKQALISAGTVLVSKDITEDIDYTPSIAGERAYEYRAPEDHEFPLAP